MKNTENQTINPEQIQSQAEANPTETDTVTDESFDNNDKMAQDLREWQDKYIRLSAEFDNFRKRTLKEKMELIANGGEDVLKAVISTADDFERALAALKDSPEAEGVRLIYQKFMDTLKSKGVTPIESTNKPLDVDYHDAVAKLPVEDPTQKGTIVDTVQKGYMLKDKVIRFAKVVVGE